MKYCKLYISVNKYVVVVLVVVVVVKNKGTMISSCLTRVERIDTLVDNDSSKPTPQALASGYDEKLRGDLFFRVTSDRNER